MFDCPVKYLTEPRGGRANKRTFKGARRVIEQSVGRIPFVPLIIETARMTGEKDRLGNQVQSRREFVTRATRGYPEFFFLQQWC